MIKKSFYPEITTIDTALPQNELEQFQNRVLRPILKLNNEVIVLYILHETRTFCKNLDELSKQEQLKMFDQTLATNWTKSALIGMIISWMDKDDLVFFFHHKSELKKRCYAMIKQRFLDQYEWMLDSNV